MRHAHRDIVDGHADNGLSEKGWEQCEALVEYFRKHRVKFDEARTSPKLRCRQTADFVAKAQPGLKVQEDWGLVEAGSQPESEFRERMLQFLEKLRSEQRCLLLCTHGDVLDIIIRWGDQSGEIRKGDLLVWNPLTSEWIVGPLRG